MFPVGGAFFLQEKTDFQATAASGRVGCVCGEGGCNYVITMLMVDMVGLGGGG